jgi:hypothetical protein
VAEPAFEVLFSNMKSGVSQNVTTTTPYEIRRYGKRFVVEATTDGTGKTSNNCFTRLQVVLACLEHRKMKVEIPLA